MALSPFLAVTTSSFTFAPAVESPSRGPDPQSCAYKVGALIAKSCKYVQTKAPNLIAPSDAQAMGLIPQSCDYTYKAGALIAKSCTYVQSRVPPLISTLAARVIEHLGCFLPKNPFAQTCSARRAKYDPDQEICIFKAHCQTIFGTTLDD